MPDVPLKVVAPVKTAWTSKINWVQAVAVVSAMLVLFGDPAGLSPEQQSATVVVITMLQGAATWIMRTWFTTDILSSSVKS